MQTVYNADVAALCRPTARLAKEIQKSASSGSSGINTFDVERLGANVRHVRSLLAWVLAEPQLDLPESHPSFTTIELPDPIRHEPVDSDEVNLVLNLAYVCEVELVNSQSARNASGLLPFDAKRLQSVLDKIDSLLANHVATASPLDLPETMPATPLSGPGSLGTSGIR